MKSNGLVRGISHKGILLVLALVLSVMFVPTAYASGPDGLERAGVPHASRTRQDPAWLRAKLAYRVVSGIQPGLGKGAHTHPIVFASPFFDPSKQNLSMRLSPNSQFAPLAGTPPSDYVYTNGDVYTAEPGAGVTNNFPGGGVYDDFYNYYYDKYYFTLCGPGATDVALFDWPWPPNDANYSYVFDPMISTFPSSSWNGTDVDGTTRTRGYLIHLGYQIQPPTWYSAGMLPQTAYQTGNKGGATLQVVQDALNWEASGENSSNWSSYFYTTQWNSDYSYPPNLFNALHSDIVTDVSVSHVPVIVEVDASQPYLPNWPNNGSTLVKHFVAIVGYDDNAGTYTYIDTCKQYTNCNGGGQDSPDLHVVSQSSLAQGVAIIGTNQNQGDGGWVW